MRGSLKDLNRVTALIKTVFIESKPCYSVWNTMAGTTPDDIIRLDSWTRCEPNRVDWGVLTVTIQNRATHWTLCEHWLSLVFSRTALSTGKTWEMPRWRSLFLFFTIQLTITDMNRTEKTSGKLCCVWKLKKVKAIIANMFIKLKISIILNKT